MPESSKEFSLDTKKSCFMQETKIFRPPPPPLLIVISYFFIESSTIKLSESSKKFSLDKKKSCLMQETKNFRYPPPLSVIITLNFNPNKPMFISKENLFLKSFTIKLNRVIFYKELTI